MGFVFSRQNSADRWVTPKAQQQQQQGAGNCNTNCGKKHTSDPKGQVAAVQAAFQARSGYGSGCSVLLKGEAGEQNNSIQRW
jgi:hypothetical protein